MKIFDRMNRIDRIRGGAGWEAGRGWKMVVENESVRA